MAKERWRPDGVAAIFVGSMVRQLGAGDLDQGPAAAGQKPTACRQRHVLTLSAKGQDLPKQALPRAASRMPR